MFQVKLMNGHDELNNLFVFQR